MPISLNVPFGKDLEELKKVFMEILVMVLVQ